MQRTLVERARNGDREAYATLASAAIGRLDATARLILRDPDSAKDAVQETLIKAWRKLPTLRDPDRFDAWLHRLLVRSCIDEHRRSRGHRVDVALAEIDVAGATDATTTVAHRDELERGFARLDPEQRAVIVLHHYLDLPMPEVAQALGIPLGTAKSRLNRSLALLRAAIDADARLRPEPGERRSGMTSNDDFVRSLELWLDDQARPAAPGYLGEVIDGVSRTNQQPAWSSLERWLPIDLTSVGRRAQLRRAAWVGVVVALLVALVTVFVLVGSPRRLPSPFGLAGNGQIAIANQDSIVVARPDGATPRVLVPTPAGVEGLTWSLDGTRLAFRTLDRHSRRPTVFVVNADGSGLIDVAPGVPPLPEYSEPISWAPDSAHLVVPSTDPVFETALLIANADGSGTRGILDHATAPGLTRFGAAWSPDGRWISFIGGQRNAKDAGLYIVRPDGTGERRVADVERDTGKGIPSWAPDPRQSRLLYVVPGGGLAVMDIATGVESRIAKTGIWPQWSPDASSIAWWFSGINVARTDQLMAGSPGRQLVVGPADCFDPRPIDPNRPCGPPIWSPDGRLMFASSGPGWTVVAVSIDGSSDPVVIPLKSGTSLNPIGSAAWQRVAP
jgi:RNA polymerase sigma-70 factor, ECF subfamily